MYEENMKSWSDSLAAMANSADVMQQHKQRPAGVCEIMKKNSSVMEENCRLADALLATLGGHKNEEKRCSPPIDSLLSETVYQEDLLNEINRKLNAAIALLTGEQ